MNQPKLASRKQRIFQYLLFFAVTIPVLVGLAQSPEPSFDRVLIDGKMQPDRIPDWILWNEIFRTAVYLYEQSPTQGKELWVDRLHLPGKAMNELIWYGYEQQEMLESVSQKAMTIANNPKMDHPNQKEDLKGKLKKSQLNMESRTLETRNKLRKRIGDDAILRLTSYARLRIAPNVKIG